jgi:hypothetical protein
MEPTRVDDPAFRAWVELWLLRRSASRIEELVWTREWPHVHSPFEAYGFLTAAMGDDEDARYNLWDEFIGEIVRHIRSQAVEQGVVGSLDQILSQVQGQLKETR